MGQRVVIAHRDPEFRARLQAELGRFGARVVAEVTDGLSALASVLELRPDLVCLAADLSHLDGPATARHLQRAQPACRIRLLPEGVTVQDIQRLVAVWGADWAARARPA